MIGTIDICVNAANPNLPLKTIFSFKTSPSSLRIIDVPKKIGNWKIDKIYLNINYPNNEVISKDAKLIGGAWVTTFEGSETVGKVEKGYTVFADGIDENNNLIEGYILGKGDVVILNSDGKVEIDNETVNLHLVKDKPESPDTGDVILEDGTYKVYADKKWNSIGDKAYFVNDSIYVDLEIEKISFDDYYTKIDNEEEILSNRVYITSSDYTTGFWNRIIEVEDPINKNDAANKKYVDDLKDKTEEKLKLYTDRSVEEVNRDLTSNYLPNTTFIPTSTSELTNDANFQNSNQVSDIVENIAYNKGLTYNKNEIDSLISSSIRFKVKEISGDVSMQLEDLTLNHISAYTGQILVLPEKQDGYKRDLQVYLENPLSDTVKWYIDKYNYIDSLENPITASVNSNSKYLYDIQDVDNSDAILVERKSIIEGTYDKGFEPLYFEAEQENSYIYLYKFGNPDTINLEYSRDKINWFDYTVGDKISCDNIGDRVYFAAKKGGNKTFSKDKDNYYIFMVYNFPFKCSGHVNSLLNRDYSLYDIVPPPYAFYKLFYQSGDGKLTTAPILDSTTLSESCYQYMFSGQSLLTQAPELPATTLAKRCYYSMFNGCRNLTTIPNDISVDTLPEECCYSMFNGAKGLSSIPNIKARKAESNALAHMFVYHEGQDLSDKKIEIDEIGEFGLDYIFSNAKMRKAPKIAFNKLSNNSLRYAFYICTNLTDATQIEINTVAQSSYINMFANCYVLTYDGLPKFTLQANQQLAESCFYGMFSDCWELTQAPELPYTNLAKRCYAHMFDNCSKLTQAPVLPATTLVDNCYEYMFQGCKALSNITVHFTNWTPTNATNYWVRHASTPGTFTCPTDLPETYGVSNIPEGWTIERF